MNSESPSAVFASSTNNNISFYRFSGFNPLESDINLVSFNIPSDICSLSTDSVSCIGNHGCVWCHSNNNVTKNSTSSISSNTSVVDIGKCVESGSNASLACNRTVKGSSACSTVVARDCGTFTSCSTCMSEYAGNNARCHWCRCADGVQRVCMSINQPCSCKLTDSSEFTINSCHKGVCYTSTCRNCKGSCFWSRTFQYVSEMQRKYSRGRDYSHNCFTRNLLKQIGSSPGAANEDSESACPAPCSTYKHCDQCVASKGRLWLKVNDRRT